MSKKAKLLARLVSRPKDFTWDETCSLMRACGYEMRSGSGGSGRMFTHAAKQHRVRLHEPHPRNYLLRYEVAELIEALKAVGELQDDNSGI